MWREEMSKGLSQKDAANMVDMLKKQREVIERLMEALKNYEPIAINSRFIAEEAIDYAKEKLKCQ
jgi:hypothetical protein